MHLSNIAICLMDSDKAIGGLYLDADDFLHTGFLCYCYCRLSGKIEESSLLFLLTDSQSRLVSVCIRDWLHVYNASQAPVARTSSPSLCINSPLMQQKGEQTICPCVWMHRGSHGHGCHTREENGRLAARNSDKSKTESVFHDIRHYITQKHICHS